LEKQSILVPLVLCWNELVYLKNLIPKLQKVSDKIVMLDGFSEDGTAKYYRDYPGVDFYQREFDHCAAQFDYGLSKCPKNNTWVLNVTADELPTTWFFDNIRDMLANADKKNIDRIFTTVFHLRGEREMSNEIGGQLRLFRNDEHHKCKYVDYPHERLHGEFDGHCLKDYKREWAYVHFRQADPQKVNLWKTHYIEKGVYSLWDINRRLNFPTVSLPSFVKYTINDELRKYLKW